MLTFTEQPALFGLHLPDEGADAVHRHLAASVRTRASAASASPARRSEMVSRNSDSLSSTSGCSAAVRARCRGLSSVRLRSVASSDGAVACAVLYRAR